MTNVTEKFKIVLGKAAFSPFLNVFPKGLNRFAKHWDCVAKGQRNTTANWLSRLISQSEDRSYLENFGE